jgi:hypothetical protein
VAVTPPTYHAGRVPREGPRDPEGIPVSMPRHPAFCAVNFRRHGQPQKLIPVCNPKRIVDPMTIFLLDDSLRRVRSCECRAYQCAELSKVGRARCKRNSVVLRVAQGRAQRCPECIRGRKQ